MATVREQIMGVLSDGLAHTRREIVDAVEAPQNQIDTMLGKLLDKGLPRRPEHGLYRLARPDDQIPQFVAPQAESEPDAPETEADAEAKPPLQIAFWSDGDVVIRRGEDTVLVLDSADVGQLVHFLARTGHCYYTRDQIAARED